jgi:hypothetical protein
MKHNIVPTTLLILLATFGLSVAAKAQTRDARCSLARAAGTYGVSDGGTIIGIGPRAAVGLVTLDAAGNIKGKVTASVNGSITHSTVSGTYTVNADCTGTDTFSEFDLSGNLILTATEDVVFDDNMREVRFLFISAALADGTSLAAVINGQARKLLP